MKTRPVIALILRALIYAVFQFLSYKYYGVFAILAAWFVIVITSWIEVQATAAKVSQTIVQTAWFVYVLAVVQTMHP
jgi:hypothetical protein